MKTAKYPAQCRRSEEWQVWVNGQECEVLHTPVGDFTSVMGREAVHVKISRTGGIRSAAVSPAARKIPFQTEEGILSFELPEPEYLYITAKGCGRPLFFYGEQEEEPEEDATYYFPAGKVYDRGILYLKSNESVYIESGAVLRAQIHTERGACNIRIGGLGILDAGIGAEGESRTILLDGCTGVRISGITIIHTPCWHMMVAGCREVVIRGVKELGEVCGSDGVDIVGSSHVLVEGCFFRCNDDCVAIKALEGGCCDADGHKAQSGGGKWNSPVEDIRVADCLFVNDVCGNVMEIGHELQTREAGNICFENIDVIRAEGYGAVFAIHAGDRALVHNVVFKNIRVEHYYEYLVDFRVMCSKYNHDQERGRIRDILLREIEVHQSADNPGYCISVIAGWDGEHTVENVTFDNFCVNGKKVPDEDAMELATRRAGGIRFC